VAIRLRREDLDVALERAFQLARSGEPLPAEWLQRVERIGAAPAKTYIAALGSAMLAKATDDRVDALARAKEAGERGYSIRGVGEFLAARKDAMGFDLGAPGRWPLNNSPFYRNDPRIDRFTGIRKADRPYFEDLVRYLRDLDRLDSGGAIRALAAFLHKRIAVADAERERQRAIIAFSSVLVDVLAVARLFVTENPEGGMRGQAFAAAVLDCAYPDVRLRRINDPQPIDVSGWDRSGMRLAVEVKQVPVDEAVALRLGADAAQYGCDRCLLVALDADQPPLDRERVRHESLRTHGVLVEVCTSVEELVSRVLLGSSLSLADAALRLQEWYAARMVEHGLSEASVERWVALCEALSVR
jgi:hypothetical protein